MRIQRKDFSKTLTIESRLEEEAAILICEIAEAALLNKNTAGNVEQKAVTMARVIIHNLKKKPREVRTSLPRS